MPPCGGLENLMKKIAILGFGTVGSGVADVLTDNHGIITKKVGDEIEIKYILDLRDFPQSPFADLVVHDFNIILNDPEISIVAEMMGGSHPAYEFSKACLEAGKSVVTSNKEVVSKYGCELVGCAREHGVSYMFEASVGGGIPIIRPICNDLASNNIKKICGILNGTTNYILTEMDANGADFSEALKQAQTLGYAEADPSADVHGIDASRKIAILAALSFGKLVRAEQIYTEGITDISKTAVNAAKSLGYSVKLIGYAEKLDGKLLCMVSPRLIPASNPLSNVNGVFNGILLSADMVGQVMFYGPGAGKHPTASAVCADIIDIAANTNSTEIPDFTPSCDSDVACFDDYSCKRFFVLSDGSDISAFDNILASATVDGHTCIICDEMTERQVKALTLDNRLGIINSIRIL